MVVANGPNERDAVPVMILATGDEGYMLFSEQANTQSKV